MNSLLPEYLTNPNCGLDIHETESADTWAKCTTSNAKIGAVIGTVIILIIMLGFCYATDIMLWRVVYILSALTLCAAILVYAFYYAENMARIDYKRFEIKLASYLSNGMSRGDAIKEINRENTQLRAAQMQSNATFQQGAMIAAAIKNYK